MKLHQLPKTTKRPNKRVGRGYGSGKGGHTSSRGQKGNLSRGSVPIWFEGGQLPQIRRFPFQRGKLRFKTLTPKPVLITLTQLNTFRPNTLVTPKNLIEQGLIRVRDIKNRPIKVVAQGTLSVPLTITIPASAKAEAAIVKAGGKVNREPVAQAIKTN